MHNHIEELIQLENDYVDYLENKNILQKDLIKKLNQPSIPDDLSKIATLLHERYGYDIDKDISPPAWALGSPLFIYLKNEYKTKQKAEAKSVWDQFVDFIVSVPDQITATGNKIINLFVNLPDIILGIGVSIVDLFKNPPDIADIGTSILDIIVKIADVVDDIARLLSGISDMALRGIVGGVNIFLHGYNMIKGLSEAYEAFNDENEKASTRLFRILAGIAKGIFGIVGTGLGIFCIVGAVLAFPLVVATAVPVILLASSILMLSNFVAELAKNIYIFDEVKQEADDSKTELKEFKQKICAKEINSPDTIYENLYELGIKREKKKINKQKSLAAEREMAFAAAEVGTGTTVAVSTVIAFAAFVTVASATTIASMGTAALAIGVIAVTAGILLKTFQFIDKKYDHKPTKFIRDSFTSLYNWFTDEKPTNELKEKPDHKDQQLQSTTDVIEHALNTKRNLQVVNRTQAQDVKETQPQVVNKTLPIDIPKLPDKDFNTHPNSPGSISKPSFLSLSLFNNERDLKFNENDDKNEISDSNPHDDKDYVLQFNLD